MTKQVPSQSHANIRRVKKLALFYGIRTRRSRELIFAAKFIETLAWKQKKIVL